MPRNKYYITEKGLGHPKATQTDAELVIARLRAKGWDVHYGPLPDTIDYGYDLAEHLVWFSDFVKEVARWLEERQASR